MTLLFYFKSSTLLSNIDYNSKNALYA